MEREKLLISQGWLQRLKVIGLVEAEKIMPTESGKGQTSYRKAKRIRKSDQEKGTKSLIYGKREIYQTMGGRRKDSGEGLEVTLNPYKGVNDQHFVDKLIGMQGIAIGRIFGRLGGGSSYDILH